MLIEAPWNSLPSASVHVLTLRSSPISSDFFLLSISYGILPALPHLNSPHCFLLPLLSPHFKSHYSSPITSLWQFPNGLLDSSTIITGWTHCSDIFPACSKMKRSSLVHVHLPVFTFSFNGSLFFLSRKLGVLLSSLTPTFLHLITPIHSSANIQCAPITC